MRLVIQRVSQASVSVDGAVIGNIGQGLLVLVGISNDDLAEDIRWLSAKLFSLRIFNDADGKMNLSLQDIQGDLLLVSQFTLYADSRKGNRPSYVRSAPPLVSVPLYNAFVEACRELAPAAVQTGKFGANMQVSLINDGPVTIILDSRQPDW